MGDSGGLRSLGSSSPKDTGLLASRGWAEAWGEASAAGSESSVEATAAGKDGRGGDIGASVNQTNPTISRARAQSIDGWLRGARTSGRAASRAMIASKWSA